MSQSTSACFQNKRISLSRVFTKRTPMFLYQRAFEIVLTDILEFNVNGNLRYTDNWRCRSGGVVEICNLQHNQFGDSSVMADLRGSVSSWLTALRPLTGTPGCNPAASGDPSFFCPPPLYGTRKCPRAHRPGDHPTSHPEHVQGV